MGFQITAFPIEVRTGNGDLTEAQKNSFATNFELARISDAGASGNLVVWDSAGKLSDGGAIPSTDDLVAKKPLAQTGNFGSFSADGDLDDSGVAASDFLPNSALTEYAKTYLSLSAIGITEMSATDWAQNAQDLVAALALLGGGRLEIPYLYGDDPNNNLASSISYVGTNGGYLSFSPSTGRLVVEYLSGSFMEATFRAYREGNVGVCTTKGNDTSGVNWKWRTVSTSESVDTTITEPKMTGYITNYDNILSLTTKGGTEAAKFTVNTISGIDSGLQMRYDGDPIDWQWDGFLWTFGSLDDANGDALSLMPSLYFSESGGDLIKGVINMAINGNATVSVSLDKIKYVRIPVTIW